MTKTKHHKSFSKPDSTESLNSADDFAFIDDNESVNSFITKSSPSNSKNSSKTKTTKSSAKRSAAKAQATDSTANSSSKSTDPSHDNTDADSEQLADQIITPNPELLKVPELTMDDFEQLTSFNMDASDWDELDQDTNEQDDDSPDSLPTDDAIDQINDELSLAEKVKIFFELLVKINPSIVKREEQLQLAQSIADILDSNSAYNQQRKQAFNSYADSLSTTKKRKFLVSKTRFEEDLKVLVREAPTGTGKSLAYLIPVILSKQKSLISTFLKTLQEQLLVDMPKIINLCNQINDYTRKHNIDFTVPISDFSYHLLKGQSNYICVRNIAFLDAIIHNRIINSRDEKAKATNPKAKQSQTEKTQQIMQTLSKSGVNLTEHPVFDASDSGNKILIDHYSHSIQRNGGYPAIHLKSISNDSAIPGRNEIEFKSITVKKLREWVQSSENNPDRLDIENLPQDIYLTNDSRSFITLYTNECPRNNCAFAKSCPYLTSRKKSKNAKVLMVNHNTMISLASTPEISNRENIIVDEAHNLPKVLIDNNSITIATNNTQKFLNDLSRFTFNPSTSSTITDFFKLDFEDSAESLAYQFTAEQQKYQQAFDEIIDWDEVSKINTYEYNRDLLALKPDEHYLAVDRELAPAVEFFYKKYYIDQKSNLIDFNVARAVSKVGQDLLVNLKQVRQYPGFWLNRVYYLNSELMSDLFKFKNKKLYKNNTNQVVAPALAVYSLPLRQLLGKLYARVVNSSEIHRLDKIYKTRPTPSLYITDFNELLNSFVIHKRSDLKTNLSDSAKTDLVANPLANTAEADAVTKAKAKAKAKEVISELDFGDLGSEQEGSGSSEQPLMSLELDADYEDYINDDLSYTINNLVRHKKPHDKDKEKTSFIQTLKHNYERQKIMFKFNDFTVDSDFTHHSADPLRQLMRQLTDLAQTNNTSLLPLSLGSLMHTQYLVAQLLNHTTYDLKLQAYKEQSDWYQQKIEQDQVSMSSLAASQTGDLYNPNTNYNDLGSVHYHYDQSSTINTELYAYLQEYKITSVKEQLLGPNDEFVSLATNQNVQQVFLGSYQTLNNTAQELHKITELKNANLQEIVEQQQQQQAHKDLIHSNPLKPSTYTGNFTAQLSQALTSAAINKHKELLTTVGLYMGMFNKQLKELEQTILTIFDIEAKANSKNASYMAYSTKEMPWAELLIEANCLQSIPNSPLMQHKPLIVQARELYGYLRQFCDPLLMPLGNCVRTMEQYVENLREITNICNKCASGNESDLASFKETVKTTSETFAKNNYDADVVLYLDQLFEALGSKRDAIDLQTIEEVNDKLTSKLLRQKFELFAISNLSEELLAHIKIFSYLAKEHDWLSFNQKRYAFVRADIDPDKRKVELHLEDLDASQAFRSLRNVLKFKTWVMTSATLSVNQSCEPFIQKLGVSNFSDNGLVPSPFRHLDQAGIFIANQSGGYRKNDDISPEAFELILANKGRCLWLCTSKRRVDALARRLEEALNIEVQKEFEEYINKYELRYPKVSEREKYVEENGYTVLSQSDNDSKSQMIERLKTENRIVIVATRSFWEGVNVPGHKLSLIIIDKYPHPQLNAYYNVLQRTRSQENYLSQYYVPDGFIVLKQGIGRLIRSEKDFGLVCILDNRLKNSAGNNRTNLMYNLINQSLAQEFANFQFLPTLESARMFLINKHINYGTDMSTDLADSSALDLPKSSKA